MKHAERNKHIDEQVEDECSYFLDALREEAEFWEEVEKEENPIVPSKVVEAATARAGFNFAR